MENKNLVINISIIIVCIVVIYYVFNDNKPENYIDPTQLPIEAVTAMLGIMQTIIDSNGSLTMKTINVTNNLTIGTTSLPGGGWAAAGNLNVQNAIVSNGTNAGIYFADRGGSGTYGYWSTVQGGGVTWNVLGTNQNGNLIQFRTDGSYTQVNTPLNVPSEVNTRVLRSSYVVSISASPNSTQLFCNNLNGLRVVDGNGNPSNVTTGTLTLGSSTLTAGMINKLISLYGAI